tara:strand:- start:6539 stop:7036 length:498 start_codon:yes stop_codon:yes gene_type:complete
MDESLGTPDLDSIIKLEKISKSVGSGINHNHLLGLWRFKYVWKKDNQNIDNISSSILQVCSAKLELKDMKYENNIPSFKIKNSLSFGLISIEFSGKAFLKGNIPLLNFYFEHFFLKLGSFKLITKSIEKPLTKNMPFFSLIAIDKKDNWLCARGRGGGLAIWVRG